MRAMVRAVAQLMLNAQACGVVPGCAPPALLVYYGSDVALAHITWTLLSPNSPRLAIDIAQKRLHLFFNKILVLLFIFYKLLVGLFCWPRGW
jgi:hypothetical protein